MFDGMLCIDGMLNIDGIMCMFDGMLCIDGMLNIDGMFMCIDGMFMCIDGMLYIDGIMFMFDGMDGKLRDSPLKPVEECSNGIDDGIDHEAHQAGKFECIDVDGIMLNSDGWKEPVVWWPPNGIMFMFIIDSIVNVEVRRMKAKRTKKLK